MSWGLAGYGDLARRRIAPALSAGETKFAGIWGRSEKLVQAMGREFDIPLATTNFKLMCEKVDFVYISTPVYAHIPLIDLALESMCHILCEKPLDAGLSPKRKLAQIGENQTQSVGVAYYRRLYPAMNWLKTEIDNNKFGKPLFAKIDFETNFSPDARDPKAWRLDRTKSGGGVVADAGSHRLDLLIWLFGRPRFLTANFENITASGVETKASLMLEWASGFQAICSFCWGPQQRDKFAVKFENQSISIDPLDRQTISRRSNGQETTKTNFPISNNPHQDLITSFEETVLRNEKPICSFHEALLVDTIISTAEQSRGTRLRIVYDD